VDQVYGYRVAIHLLEPPLTEMPGMAADNYLERSATTIVSG
jgi:hypothetical protein